MLFTSFLKERARAHYKITLKPKAAKPMMGLYCMLYDLEELTRDHPTSANTQNRKGMRANLAGRRSHDTHTIAAALTARR